MGVIKKSILHVPLISSRETYGLTKEKLIIWGGSQGKAKLIIERSKERKLNNLQDFFEKTAAPVNISRIDLFLG
ncbi:hypothetical protein PARA125_000116 [Parachlamydia sp. AcF125]|nr:hypothetical protein [Parachlamydia sp. AcF125]